jgi:transcriptional regulator with XRE-family HTH domain
MSSTQPATKADESPMVAIERHKLRSLRQQRGLNQYQLAARAGLSFGYIGHLERGTRLRVSPRVLALLCMALDVQDRTELMAS